MGYGDFGWYRRRVNGWEDSRLKHRGLPHDSAELLALALELELIDRIIVDRTDKDEL